LIVLATVLCAALAPSLAPRADPFASSLDAGAKDATVESLVALHAPRCDEREYDVEELAKELANPVASLLSFTFQYDYDSHIGPGDNGERQQLAFRPVLPLSLNEDWNVISRTVLPLVYQHSIAPGEDHEFGLGDVTQSFFVSPVAPARGGIIWGAGPVFLIPTATEDLLGTEKWGLGPTAVALRQHGPWTYGALVEQIWSFAGDDDRSEVSSLSVQPFVSHTTSSGWTGTLELESTYDWHADELALPIDAFVSKVALLGRYPISFGAGIRYWAHSADDGPEGWGLRVVIAPLVPRRK
jgi:hypothetical protein